MITLADSCLENFSRRFFKLSLITAMTTALLVLSFGPRTVAAQEVMKHPRVVELEDRLNGDAAAYIKSRFPGVPFMVIVRVDPLRRDALSGDGGERSERLPYFEALDNEEEIRDEWDNPQVPLMALLNRVRRTSVQISIPSKLKEAEVNEMKDGIFNILHLTPARDTIEISRREWAVDEVPWLGVYIAGAAMFLLLVGLLIINRTSANRIARALTEMKVQNGSGSQGVSAPPPMGFESEASAGRSGQNQEVTFNDPMKMKELASGLISFLSKSQKFPNHHDMFTLDRLGVQAPDKLGALLLEFPTEVQVELFKYSSGNHWVEALNEPGFLDFDCLEALQSVSQNVRDERSRKVSKAVLAVWRLGELRSKFLRTISKDEAFWLLTEMPKSIGVAEARKVFPGAWGAILDPKFEPKEVNEKRLSEIHDAAAALETLHDIGMVRSYRADKELLSYVKCVDPSEERDIYEAASEASMIHKMRSPFYPVFSQSEEVLKKLVSKNPVDRWALALFNVMKTDRQLIDRHFSDKQKFLLIERFKRFDQNSPSLEMIGTAREAIGASLRHTLKEMSLVKEETSAPVQESESTNEAA